MSKIRYSTTSTTGAPAYIKVPTAAKALGVGENTLRKAIAAGFVPAKITAGYLAQLCALEAVTGVEIDTPTGAWITIPVLRPKVAEVADDGDDRDYVGVKEGMTPKQFVDATLRWWPPINTRLAEEAGYLFVVLGGFVVGVLAIEDFEIEDGDAKGYFNGYIVAILRGYVGTGRVEIVEPEDPHAMELAQLVGLRAPGGGGTSITRWNG